MDRVIETQPAISGDPAYKEADNIVVQLPHALANHLRALSEVRYELQFGHSLPESCIGGSDARVIMGGDEAALLRLWREKRGEIEPEDLSGNLIVQLGLATEDLNRRWYQANSGRVLTDVQRRIRHPALRWMSATLDGRIEATGAVFEAKFMLPWSFSEEAAAEKHMPQLQHNMWVVAARSAVLSVITGGGKWVEITTHADPLHDDFPFEIDRWLTSALDNKIRSPSPRLLALVWRPAQSQ
jgi:predicted phage-related endonuclease